MMAAALSALLSHWRRNPMQGFTLVAGLALATALWSGVQAINLEARASYDAAAATLGEGHFDQLVPARGNTVPEARYIALRRAGWQVAPVLEGRLRLERAHLRLVGIDPLTAPAALGAPLRGTGLDLADFLAGRIGLATPETIARHGAALPLPLIADAGIAPGTVLTDIGAAQRLLGQPGRISRMIVLPQQPMGRPPLAQIAPDLERRAASAEADLGLLTDSFHLNLTAFGLLSFAVGIFIVHGAIGLAFEQRRGMVRTLRALGLPLDRLILLLGMEILVLALVGGAIGMVLGYGIAAALLPDVAATLDGLYGAQVGGSLHLRPVWWLSGLGMATAGAVLAAGSALWRIARMPLLTGAQPRAWAMTARHGRRRQAALAAILLVIAAGLALRGTGLIAGFAVLACLLLGAALALPPLLDVILAIAGRRARGVTAQWFWADTRQQLPGLSLALMALLLAMAANIGVSTMVSSFRLTFVGFLDQRLASELYISARNAEDSAALEAYLRPRADAILPILSVETRIMGQPAALYGARIGPTYTENWRFLASDAEVWPRVAQGKAVIVNEQLARRAGLGLGARVEVAPGLDLPVAGIVGDYGNPIGQAILGEDLFRALHPDVHATRFGLRSTEPEALRRALIEDYGLPESRIVNQQEIKALSLGVFERTFTVTGALNVLTLAVAGFAMLMALLTLAALRLPQLAPAWALGLTRRDLGRLELLRAVALAVLTALLALPLGLALAWVLLAIVNVQAFGWRLPMYLFPADYLRLVGLAMLAAGLAALWPALRLARMPPASLLKVFAHER